MAFIEISDLSAAGSDLFAGASSLLTELKTTDSRQIFGGGRSRSTRTVKRNNNGNDNGNDNGNIRVSRNSFGNISGTGPGGGTLTIGNGNNNGNGNRID